MSGPSWLGLLKWSLQQQDASEAPSEAREMPAEDKQWLKEALQHLVRDDVERLTQINAELKKVLDGDVEVDYEGLIEELRDITEQIDMATIFVRIGGVRHLLGVLTAESSTITAEARAQAAGALSTLAQNNPETQHMLMTNSLVRRKNDDEAAKSAEEVVDGGVIATLQRAFFTTDNAVVRTRIIQALSAIVRGQGDFEERLCLDDLTLQILHESIADNENPRLQSKAAFVSKALLTSDSCTAPRVLRLLPVAVQAVSLIASEDADLREQAQSFVLAACRRGAASRILGEVGNAEVEQVLVRAESIARNELDAQTENEDRTFFEGYVQLVQQLRDALLQPTTESASLPAASPVLMIQNPGPSAAPPGP